MICPLYLVWQEQYELVREEEASGIVEREGYVGFGQGVWQEDLPLLFLLQLYWLEPCIELDDFAALYGLSYAPLRGECIN